MTPTADAEPQVPAGEPAHAEDFLGFPKDKAPTLTGEPGEVRTSTEPLPAGTVLAEAIQERPTTADLLPGMPLVGAISFDDHDRGLITIRGVAYVSLDTETSGLPLYNEEINGKKVSVGADDPRQPYVAQACMIFLDDQLVEIGRFSGYVKPEGWVMEPGATAVNHLTTEFLLSAGRPIGEVLDVYEQAVKAGAVICCHNAQFDTKMMRGALRRAKRDDLFEETNNFCTMRKWAQHQSSKWPKLDQLCVLLGIKQAGGHSAEGDAEAVVDILREFRALKIPLDGAVHTSAHHPSRQTA